MKMTVIEGTHNVFLPESVLGIAQQKFFGHEGAVQPDCTTADKREVVSHLFSFSLQYVSLIVSHELNVICLAVILV